MFSLCRLCADCKDLEELTTEITELKPKLAVCCDWFPSVNESQMPQKACITCVEQLEKSWSFAEGVEAAEIKLNELLMEQDPMNTQSIGQETVTSDDHIPSIKFHPMRINATVMNIDNDCHPAKRNQKTVKRGKLSSSPISPQWQDRNHPTDGATNEYDGSSHSIQSEETDSRCIAGKKATPKPFLAQLDVEDQLTDGTISVNGVAKLEKLFPEMKTMAWSDCEYKCYKCDRLFKGPHNFHAHNRSLHFNEVQSMVFRCFYCKEEYQQEYIIGHHMAREHFPHLKYRCCYCSDYFWDRKKLIKHQKKHTDVEYLCELCNQVFMSRDILYSHILHIHQKIPERKFTCDICSRDFGTKWSIEHHMLQHSKKVEFDYVCDQCGRKFQANGNLNEHLQTTHSDIRNFVCKECSGRFKTKRSLAAHSKRHGHSRAFACKVCDKRFRQAQTLKVHMRIHDNIFPYACRFCDRKFREHGGRKSHERTHTAERPYRCVACEYRSANWQNLNKHSVRIHSIDLKTLKNKEYLQKS